jgi:electron transport complex protein RnfE
MSANPTHLPAGPTATDDFLKGIWRDNPVLVQVLGTCPTLAVTNSAQNAVAMGLATTFVLVLSNVAIASIRHFVPKQVRIASYILVIASFVTIVDYAIQAISLDLHKALGAFIALIVVNCIILGRAEAFASKNTVGRSFLDGLGMGVGFCLALLLLGTVREILGSGALFGVELFGPWYQDWVIMVLPSGGFFTYAGWLLLFAWWKDRSKRLAGRAAVAVTAGGTGSAVAPGGAP